MSIAFRPRPTWMRHYVLAAVCAATTINYIQRNSYGGAEKTIRGELHLLDTQAGNIISAFFFAYALCQIPSGRLAEWLTPRWALALYAAGWSVATAACALADGAPGLLGARLVMGVLQAGIFPCATMILLVWYPSTRRALATAILNSFMLIGGAVGAMLTGWLLPVLGWRWLFVLYAAPGILWAGWFLWWFRNRPSEHSGVNDAELSLLPSVAPAAPDLTLKMPAGPPLWAIILSWPLLLLCLQQFCRAGATRFWDQWFVTYLQEAREQSVREANFLSSAPQWAGVVGGLVGGLASDAILQWTGSRRAGRKGVAIGSLLVGFGCYAAAYAMPNVYAAVAMASMGTFIAMFSAPCAALSMDMSGRNLAIVFGAMNMMGNFGAFAFTWVVPRLKAWGGDWTLPLLVFGGMQVVAAVCWLLLNPSGVIGEPAAVDRVVEKEEEVDGRAALP